MARETVVRVSELESGAWGVSLPDPLHARRAHASSPSTPPPAPSPTPPQALGSDRVPLGACSLTNMPHQVGGATPCRTSVQGRALLGYCALGPTAFLLATRVRPTVRSLPGGTPYGLCLNLSGSRFPSAAPLWALSKGEAKAVSELTDVLISDVHFFCETRDLTRPFPSPFPPHCPDPGVVLEPVAHRAPPRPRPQGALRRAAAGTQLEYQGWPLRFCSTLPWGPSLLFPSLFSSSLAPFAPSASRSTVRRNNPTPFPLLVLVRAGSLRSRGALTMRGAARCAWPALRDAAACTPGSRPLSRHQCSRRNRWGIVSMATGLSWGPLHCFLQVGCCGL